MRNWAGRIEVTRELPAMTGLTTMLRGMDVDAMAGFAPVVRETPAAGSGRFDTSRGLPR
jgi:hypothetical protein